MNASASASAASGTGHATKSWGKILKSQCPSIFTIEDHYKWDFSECHAAAGSPRRTRTTAARISSSQRVPLPPHFPSPRTASLRENSVLVSALVYLL
jgi:hypothetical protein